MTHTKAEDWCANGGDMGDRKNVGRIFFLGWWGGVGGATNGKDYYSCQRFCSSVVFVFMVCGLVMERGWLPPLYKR